MQEKRGNKNKQEAGSKDQKEKGRAYASYGHRVLCPLLPTAKRHLLLLAANCLVLHVFYRLFVVEFRTLAGCMAGHTKRC